MQEKEDGELSDAFWDVNLVQRLDTSVASSPFFNVFLAAQVKNNDRGFLSKEISVNNLIIHRGDIHHIFPKKFLVKEGAWVLVKIPKIIWYVLTNGGWRDLC